MGCTINDATVLGCYLFPEWNSDDVQNNNSIVLTKRTNPMGMRTSDFKIVFHVKKSYYLLKNKHLWWI